MEPSSSHQRAKAPDKIGQGWMESKVEGIMKVFTNHPLHVVVEGQLGPGVSHRVSRGMLADRSLANRSTLGCSAAWEEHRFQSIMNPHRPLLQCSSFAEHVDNSFVGLFIAHLAFLCTRPVFLKVGSRLRFFFLGQFNMRLSRSGFVVFDLLYFFAT